MPRKMGRPTKLRQLIAAPTDDNPTRKIRIGDYVCELMTIHGTSAVTCAEHAGVARNTIKHWLRLGADAEQRDLKGRPLTPDDVLHRDFLIATRAAHAKWIHDRTMTHAQMATGGLTVTEVVQEVDPTQQVDDPERPGRKRPLVLKSRTKTRRMLPDAKAIEWELERLALDEDGNRMFAARVEVTGADGGPVQLEDKDARAAALAAELAAFQAGAESARELEAERNGSEP